MNERDRSGAKQPEKRPAGAAASKADAESDQQKWRDKTLAAHDAAAEFYKNNPPKRKI